MSRRLVLSTLLVVVGSAVSGCGGEEEQPGSPEVYARIEMTENCGALQETYERAAGNNETAEEGSAEFDVTLGYMQAALKRMEDLGCP